jgi:hypothetical protein
MRIALHISCPQADEVEQFARRRMPLRGRAKPLQPHRLGDIDAHRHAWIE